MKITEYGKTSDLGDNRVILTDGDGGTKIVPIEDLLYKLIDYGGELAGKNRRNTLRGKNLGSSVTEDQWQKISDAKFQDMFLGDYWLIDGFHWRIADFDYLYNTGNTQVCTKHHLVIVPDEDMGSTKMNSSNVTDKGYSGAEIRTGALAEAKSKIEGIFGVEHVLPYNDILTTASANGIASAYAWAEDLKVELMTEAMVYGTRQIASGSIGTTVATVYTICRSQLALFQADPTRITTRYWYWLRDIVSATRFAHVSAGGESGNGNASTSFGLRPFFIIG